MLIIKNIRIVHELDTALTEMRKVSDEHNHMLQGDYSEYKYIYKKEDENTVILTNNEEDIYVNIAPESTVPSVEPELYVPTLDELKENKIKYFSSLCNQAIINGVDIEINGVMEHFSYNDEDQVNIKEIFDLAVQTNVPMYYHADGDSCKMYTVDQIIALYITATTNKMHHTTYFNQLTMFINAIEDKEELSALKYGDELTGEYLKTYNDAMKQAALLLEVLLQSRQTNNIPTTE